MQPCLTYRNVVLFSSMAMLGLMFDSVCYGQAAPPPVVSAKAMISGPPARGNTPILVSCVCAPAPGLKLKARAFEMQEVMPGMWARKPKGKVLDADMVYKPFRWGGANFDTWTTDGAVLATGSGTWQIVIIDATTQVVGWTSPDNLTP